MEKSDNQDILHPLHYFGYCPHCGSKQFAIDGPRSKKCGQCGFTYFFNPAASVAALITDAGGRLLLTRRAFDPKKGTLDLPGGFAELDETLEEALRREIKEELGANLINVRYYASHPNRYPFSGLTIHTLDCFFTAQLAPNIQLKADDDVAGFVWLLPKEIDVNQIGLDSIRQIVAKWKSENG